MPTVAANITEPLATSLYSNLTTAFDLAISGSTSAKKVWRNAVPQQDSGGARIEPPWLIFAISSRGRSEEFSNMDQYAPDGFVDLTVTSVDRAGVSGATEVGLIVAQLEARLTLTNVSATGFVLHRFHMDTSQPRADNQPQAVHHYQEMTFIFLAYPA